MVVRDSAEGFFERLTLAEMSIQMRLEQLSPANSRDSLMPLYLAYLQADVADFKPQEAALAHEAMQQALALSLPHLKQGSLPQDIQLIKTRGNYYGSSVFYTRDRAIVIPEAQLQADNPEALTRVLIHEIFHIYSRFNPVRRDSLYAFIGFERLQGDLQLNTLLQKQALYNPDGVVLHYAIEVEDAQGRSFRAIPAIFSKASRYQPDFSTQFFGYIQFRLFEVEPVGAGWRVIGPEAGHDPKDLSGFFEQIGRNTGYIIHPDEVLADNLVILALGQEKDMQGRALSPEGKALNRRFAELL